MKIRADFSDRPFIPHPELLFDQLDRDHDGNLSGFDLGWSDSNSWVRQSCMVNRMFRKFDADGDGLLTAAEWQAWFARVSADGQPVRFEQNQGVFGRRNRIAAGRPGR